MSKEREAAKKYTKVPLHVLQSVLKGEAPDKYKFLRVVNRKIIQHAIAIKLDGCGHNTMVRMK